MSPVERQRLSREVEGAHSEPEEFKNPQPVGDKARLAEEQGPVHQQIGEDAQQAHPEALGEVLFNVAEVHQVVVGVAAAPEDRIAKGPINQQEHDLDDNGANEKIEKGGEKGEKHQADAGSGHEVAKIGQGQGGDCFFLHDSFPSQKMNLKRYAWAVCL